MNARAVTDSIFASICGDLLPCVPPWVRRGLSRRFASAKLLVVSAVCPDYARSESGFTYAGVGTGVPYIAREHLLLMRSLGQRLALNDIELEYHVVLADTEFDLPFVVRRMTGGDADEFLRRCEASCQAIRTEGASIGLEVRSSQRFTTAFPCWFETYREALEVIEDEIRTDASVRYNLEINLVKRMPLYRAMTVEEVTLDYCRQMAKRQWAQYMAWGRLAEAAYGGGLVMVNHATPNLSRVNHSFARQGRERIPILELALTTMPG